MKVLFASMFAALFALAAVAANASPVNSASSIVLADDEEKDKDKATTEQKDDDADKDKEKDKDK